MTPFELSDLLRFFVQAGLALAGAFAFWSFGLRWRAQRASANEQEAYHKLVDLLAKLFFASIVLFLILWWFAALFVFLPQGMAHEGIKIDHALEEIVRGYEQNIPIATVLTLFALAGVVARSKLRPLFETYARVFFAAQFCFLTLVTIAVVWQGTLDVLFFSSFFHSWHSFLTFGTVIVVDVLYVFTLRKDHLQKVMYPFFPIMSAAIWAGLGLDFLSAGLVFSEALRLSPQFYFVQTVIAIIIINGALLSGKITDKLNAIARSAIPVRLSKRLQYIFGFSGAVSIVSWTTITFVDFFEFPFSYGQFLFFYAVAIALAYLGHFGLEKLRESRLAGAF